MTSLQFNYPAPTDIGVRRSLLPGIDWVRLSLPFALDHVNCWWLHGDGETWLIDTGVSSKRTRQIWTTFIKANGIPDALLATHYHPDHTGLASWFAEAGAELYSHKVEQQYCKKIFTESDHSYSKRFAGWYLEHGIDAEKAAGIWTRGNGYRQLVYAEPQLDQWRYVSESDSIAIAGRHYSVLVGHGHSPAMLMLYCESDGFLIAADQVLPTISPNVSLMPGSVETDPLAGFLSTLEQLKDLPADTLVLPSHGEPFTGLHARLHDLIAHHESRMDDLVAHLDTPTQAEPLFSVMFKRELDDLQLGFALGETLAHLRCLEGRGRVTQEAYNGGHWFIRS